MPGFKPLTKTCDQISNRKIPAGFLPLSVAVNRLAEGMWAGLPRAKPAQRLKLKYFQLSVEFAPRAKARRRRLEGSRTE
jgi:hypothetical protein